jgi:hypothetical protein
VARSSTSFTIGNKAAARLTQETFDLIVNTVAQTGRISVAAGRACVGLTTVRDWLRKGRTEKAEPIFVELADAVERARAEYLALAAKRLGQLAQGGTLMLPKYDKQNRLIRDENDDLVFEERFFPPDVRALTHILDRIDPMPNLEPEPAPGAGPLLELTDAEQIAEAAEYFDLFSETIRTMIELGYPVSRLYGNARAQTAIETSAVQAPQPAAEPAKVESAEETPLESETPTEPRRPKFEDAF